MFGSHLSIAGGAHNALIQAKRFGMDCVQVFTKNQRQWKVKPLGREAVELWARHRHETGITEVVSHDSYLINLASPDDELQSKSIALFREELLRCETLHIPFLVAHPGAHMKAGEAAGLKRIAQSLNQLHCDLPGLKTITCLEVTAGQGSSLGYRFEHLRQIIDMVRQPQRLAICLDTAHMLAAGYDLTSAESAQAVLDELNDIIGLQQVRVVHVNDSKTPRGSRVDRHEHIGHGHVSLDAFKVIVNEPHLKNVPKILETPKQDAPDGRPWDLINLEALRGLVRQGRRTRADKKPAASARKKS